MPPKKTIENERVLNVKGVKGIQKKNNCASTPAKRRVKVTPNTNMSPTAIKDKTIQNTPPKVVKRVYQRKKKLDLNVSDGADTNKNVINSIPKSKGKPGPKSKNEKKTTANDESLNECDSPVTVPPRGKTRAKKKNISQEINIMLANEVIRSAFQKKPAKAANIELSNNLNCNVTKQKPSRLKKTVVKFQDYAIDSKIQPTTTNSVANIELIQEVAKKKPVKSKKRTLDDETPLGDHNSTTEEIPKKRKRLSLKRKVIPNPQIQKAKRGLLTKRNKAEKITCTDSTPQKSTDETNNHALEKSNSMRKNSTSSASTCFSWTKDISSSSAVTCVTVQSHDFVRIDKKLPLIKLADINRQKDTNDDIFDDVSIESANTRKISECSSTVSTVDLSNSHELNLSTSSLTSVTNNTIPNKVVKEPKDNESVVKKLRKSLDSLSSMMKNFDLEIINWIGYDNRIKDRDTLDYHERVFQVLKEENEIIKSCREIKKVLLGNADNQIEVSQSEPNKSKTYKVREPEPNISPELRPSKPNNKKEAEPKPIGDIADPDKTQSVFLTPSNSSQIKDRLKKSNTKNENNFNSTTVNCSDRSEGSNKNNNKPARKECSNSQIDHTDDDDAISLFAESITGLETPRRNSIGNTNHLEDALGGNTTRDIRKSSSDQQFYRTLDDYDDNSFESGEYVDSLTSNGDCEEQTTQNSPQKLFERNLLNATNVREKSPVSPSNIQGLSNKFNTLTDRPTSNNINEFMKNLDNFKRNHSTPLNASTNLARFPDLKNVQVKVPANSDSSKNRRFQIVENPDRGIQHSTEIAKLHNTDSRTLVNGPEERNSQSNEVTNNIEKATFVTDITSLQSIAEQPKPQLPNLIPNKQYQNRGTVIFKGCIFNLASACKKNNNCNYAHVTLETKTVTDMLQTLSDSQFIQECSFLFMWHVLVLKYGLCFIHECIRRSMSTRLLRIVEYYVAYVHRSPDIVVEATETALLYLNDADFKSCYDGLKCSVGRGYLLCDHFMKSISETQNFSRFKSVFIKLVLFMSEIGRRFNLRVASQLLERVSILGFDDVLAAAIIQLLDKTDTEIFSVPMMSTFEKRLIANNVALYEQLMDLKTKAGVFNVLPSPQQLSPCVASASQSSTSIGRGESHAVSMESPNKKTSESITRTIINQPMASQSSDSSGEFVKRKFLQAYNNNNKNKKQRWRPPQAYRSLLGRPRPPWHPPRPYIHNQQLYRKPAPGS